MDLHAKTNISNTAQVLGQSPGVVQAVIVTTIVVAAVFIVVWQIKKRRLTGGASSVNKLAAALRDEKMKSSIIVSAIEDGVVLFDDQQMIRSFNPAAGLISGWQPAEAMNLDYSNVLKIVDKKGDPYEGSADPFKRVFSEKATIRVNDAELVTQSNKRIPISLSVSPLIEESAVSGKHVYAAVAVLRDVTQERAEETQRGEFISTASHEMRTPVAAIEGYLSLALNDKVSTIDSRARDYLEKAHTSTEHLGKLFQDLLTSARAEDGRLSSHPIVVEMGEYLQQISDDLRFAASKKGLAMEFAVGSSQIINATDENIPSMSGKVVKPLYFTLVDADRMREVITNLFDNAVKYTDTGKISIGITGNNDVVQLFVRDTGPGIPAEDQPHLFQKFYRVDNSATRTIGGTGLGLFICRKIVELYQGRIWVESQPGQGSTFYINLPRLSAQQAGQLQATEANNSALPAISSLATS